ncbi:MAG: biotin/lipoyl-binding protein [Muribaculaceae bacterium]|nr:biotin/lipoyl-binding protein [Muribaculaceae bacterium]
MRLNPKVRRDAGLVPLVTPTSQIVGAQAVNLALDRKKGKPDYSNTSNQFISLVKGEYGHTPVEIDPEFRAKITGDATERPYDVNSYKQPENPALDDLGGTPLAVNNQEKLLLELLPTVAKTFLRRRRQEEFDAANAAKAAEVEASKEDAVETQPIVGPVLSAPMGGKVLSVNVKPGDEVKPGQLLLVYEAMKMENDVEAEKAAKVRQVFVVPDQVIGTDAPLIEFEP